MIRNRAQRLSEENESLLLKASKLLGHSSSKSLWGLCYLKDDSSTEEDLSDQSRLGSHQKDLPSWLKRDSYEIITLDFDLAIYGDDFWNLART